MKKFFVSILLTVAMLATAALPTGCATRLSEDGVYQGDTFLYGAERTITSAYKSFDAFLFWEQTYRNTLPPEVSRAADVIRLNAKKWIDSAHAFRDAYAANPSGQNRDNLKLSLDLIDTALREVASYYAANNAKAPPVNENNK
jgi:hypothetical protein